MTNNRIWMIACLMVSGLVLAGTWFLGVSPTLAAAATADVARADAEAQNMVNESALAKLKSKFETIGALKASLVEVAKSVPGEAAMPAFLDSIDGAAQRTGAFVTSIGTADATYYIGAAIAETPVDPAAEEGAEAAEAESAAPAADTTAGAVPIPVALPATEGAELLQSGNFVLVPVTMTAKGSLDQVLAFVKAAQESERIFSVSSLDIAQDVNSGGFEVTTAGFIYVLSGGAVGGTGEEAPGAVTTTTLN